MTAMWWIGVLALPVVAFFVLWRVPREEVNLICALVNTTQLSQRLRVAPASVTNMIQRLAEHGLLRYEPYRGVSFTDEGERAAEQVIRRHEAIKQYLVSALGFDADQAHAEAERLEHVVSGQMEARMRALANQPAAS